MEEISRKYQTKIIFLQYLKYVKLDYSESAQKRWKQICDDLVKKEAEKKKTDTKPNEPNTN